MTHHPSPQSFDEIIESIKSTPPLYHTVTHGMTTAELERKRQERRERYRRT